MTLGLLEPGYIVALENIFVLQGLTMTLGLLEPGYIVALENIFVLQGLTMTLGLLEPGYIVALENIFVLQGHLFSSQLFVFLEFLFLCIHLSFYVEVES